MSGIENKEYKRVEIASFEKRINQIKKDIEHARFKGLFRSLKEIQKETWAIPGIKRPQRQALLKNIQQTFEALKEKQNLVNLPNLEQRIEHLQEVIKGMNSSILRDKKELNFQVGRRAKVSLSVIEDQFRKIKENELAQRIISKEKKIASIRKTLDRLSKMLNKKAK